jgi:hypothetical protein
MSSEQHGPIFIFGSGQRCGSTLLQRFLCTHPDVLIWGEHDGVFQKVFEQFERLVEWNRLFGHHFERFTNGFGANTFIANMNPPLATIAQAQTDLFMDLWARPAQAMGKDIWGFKEVLYGADMALKLRAIFPDARVIHITRNVFSCFTSLLHEERLKPGQTYVPLKEVWTRARTIESVNHWTRINRSFIDTPGLDDDWVYTVRYEDLTGDTAKTTRGLLDWLGLHPEDFNFAVFDHKIYTDRHHGPDDRPKITWADLSAEEFYLITTEEILDISRHYGFVMLSSPQPEPHIEAIQKGLKQHDPVH